MSRTKRVNVTKIDIYPFRHSPARDFRQAISHQSTVDDEEVDYKSKSRHFLNKTNITSARDGAYKRVFQDLLSVFLFMTQIRLK
jgi:hypothetical protein